MQTIRIPSENDWPGCAKFLNGALLFLDRRINNPRAADEIVHHMFKLLFILSTLPWLNCRVKKVYLQVEVLCIEGGPAALA